MKRIAIFSANRAEHGLLEPVMAELEKLGPEIQPFWAEGRQHADDLVSGLELAAMAVILSKTDIALVPCDRQEMVGVALYLFYHNVPFAQFHAGDIGSGVHDEIGRWIISKCASIHFCNSPESAQNLVKMGEEPWRVHLVGSTAFDMTTLDGLDESIIPKEPFDLLLIHPDTYDELATSGDTYRALNVTMPLDRLTVAIGPNHDKHWMTIEKVIFEWQNREFAYENVPGWQQPDGSPPRFIYYPSLPRPQFLALMKHCKRFITNSSSALYELPAFDISKWVSIGKRNADRKPLSKIELGGAKRIAEVLKNLVLDDKLLRKQFTLG